MSQAIDWSRILMLAIPVILIQICLQVIALVDLARVEQGRMRGPKWVWVVIIVLGEILGPIIYFFAGKREA